MKTIVENQVYLKIVATLVAIRFECTYCFYTRRVHGTMPPRSSAKRARGSRMYDDFSDLYSCEKTGHRPTKGTVSRVHVRNGTNMYPTVGT